MNSLKKRLTNLEWKQGDDGGPLNYYNPKLDRWFVVGVAGRSNSASCRRMKSSSGSSSKRMDNDIKIRPNLLTRVRSQLDFIRDHSGVVPPSKWADVKKSPAIANNIKKRKNRMRQFPTLLGLPPAETYATKSATARDHSASTLKATTTSRPLYETGEFSCMGKSSGNYPTASCSPNFFMCSQYDYHTFVSIAI